MKSSILILWMLFAAVPAWGFTVNRTLEISTTAGFLNTRGLLQVKDGVYPAATLSVRMHILERVGYFLDFTLAPVSRRNPGLSPQGTPLYQDVVMGFFGVGPFVSFHTRTADFTYRFGYGAAGDGRYASGVFLHGFTASRLLFGHLSARLDLHHILSSTHRIGTWGLSVGAGWTF